jgi:hypothetical protein
MTMSSRVLFDAKIHQAESLKTKIIILCLSVALFCSCSVIVGYLQYQSYGEYLETVKAVSVEYNVTSDNVETLFILVATGLYSRRICETLKYGNFPIVTTSIALLLMIFYACICKRRSFLNNKIKCGHFGLPLIISCWNKTDRFYTSIIYGRIAYEVFDILLVTLTSSGPPLFYVKTAIDPSGILALVMTIIKVLFVGLREFRLF